MSVAPRHRCRYCKTKLSVPTENKRHAFCTPGCHSSFYRSRCLVCEEPIRRKNGQQKLGSGHKTCAAEYRRFPRAYEYPQTHKTALPTGNVNDPPRSGDKMGLKSAHPALPGWRWEAERDWEGLRLIDRDGRLAARLWPVANYWHVVYPALTRAVSDLDAAKRLAISMALANLPLERGPASSKPSRAPLNLQVGEPRMSFRIAEAKIAGDPGEFPSFLKRRHGLTRSAA